MIKLTSYVEIIWSALSRQSHRWKAILNSKNLDIADGKEFLSKEMLEQFWWSVE